MSIDKRPIYSIIYINKCADGKKYHTIPTVQRAAVWCKAVSASCGKSSRSSLPNGCKTLVSSAGCSRYRAGLCWKPVRGCAQHANESGTAESLMITRSLSLDNRGQRPFLLKRSSPGTCKKWKKVRKTGETHHAVEWFSDFCGGPLRAGIEHEAHELIEKLEEGQKFMTTSCCPS